MRAAVHALGLVLFVGLFLGAGCPPPKPTPIFMDLGPPPDLAVPVGVGACPATMVLPDAADVCDGQFTVEGYACVLCQVAACLDVPDKMYCVQKSCTSDVRCGPPKDTAKKPNIKSAGAH